MKPIGEAPLDGMKTVTQKDVDEALTKIKDVGSVPKNLWTTEDN
jgi:hypothetical protein